MSNALTWDENLPPPDNRAEPAGHRGGDQRGGSGDSFFRLPDQLAREWVEVRRLDSGGQARVLLVQSRRDPEMLRVLKIYNINNQPRPEVVERYASLDPRYVVRMIDTGEIDDQRYEIMEYARGGALLALIERQRGQPMPPERVRRILENLVPAIVHIHAQGIVHRDLKPANILVRSTDPLDLVLADFGIAASMRAMSERVTTGGRTAHYAPRETLWNRVSREADWWSVGIILVEMLTGRHPLTWPESGELLPVEEVTRILTTEPADILVEDVSDQRWRLLCRGLLRHDRSHRWTGNKVRRWLEGEDESTLIVEEDTPRRRRRFPLGGREIEATDPSEFARVLSEQWEAARQSFARGHITEWASQDPLFSDIPDRLREIDRAYQAGEYRRGDDQGVDEALFRALIIMAPSFRARFIGYELSEAGLDELAVAAILGDVRARDAIRQMFERGILESYAAETGMPSYAALHLRWQQEVQRFIAMARLMPEETRPALEARIDLAVALALRGSLPDSDRWLTERRTNAQERFRRTASQPAWMARLRGRIGDCGAAQLVVLDVALDHVAALQAAEEDMRARRPPMERLLDGLGMLARILIVLAVVGGGTVMAVGGYRSWQVSRDSARAGQVVTHISFGRTIDDNNRWLIDAASGNPPQVRAPDFALIADVSGADPGRDRIRFTLTRAGRPLQSNVQIPLSPAGRVNTRFAGVAPGDYVVQTAINDVPGYSASVRVVAP